MTCLDRQQNPLRGKDSAQQVADRYSNPGWPAFDRSRNAHQPRKALCDLVETGIVAHWTIRSESRNTACDYPGITRCDSFVAKTQRLDYAGTEVIDYDVGSIDQP